MEEAVQILLQEDGEERDEQVEDHMAADGYYSSEVLAQVIRSKALVVHDRVRWEMVLQPVTTKHELETAMGHGAAPGQCSLGGLLRFFNDIIFRLDSLARTPEQLIDQAFLQELRRLPNTFAIREV